MIKTLKHKFVTTSMLSFSLVLLILLLCINLGNYLNSTSDIDSRIEYLKNFKNGDKNLDKKPDKDMALGMDSDKDPGLTEAGQGGFFFSFLFGSNRKPAPDLYEKSRHFTVTINEKGTVVSYDTGTISIDSDELQELGAVVNKHTKNGYLDNYRYSLLDTSGTYSEYLFLDCTNELNQLRSFMSVSIIIGALGLILVYIFLRLLSGKAIAPIVESYTKQKQFITDASHELKTPLTIIEANVEVLEMTQGENEWIESTKKQVKRLTDLTNDLVFLSRMEEADSSFEMSDFNLSDAVIDTISPYATVASNSGKTIDSHIEENIIYKGNEKTLRQLVRLLMDNAIKYSSDKSEIQISLAISGSKIELKVRNAVDDGPTGNLDMFFDRFYRADKSRNQKTGGFGVGLSVAKAIVDAHHGKISSLGDGSSVLFFVTLS